MNTDSFQNALCEVLKVNLDLDSLFNKISSDKKFIPIHNALNLRISECYKGGLSVKQGGEDVLILAQDEKKSGDFASKVVRNEISLQL